MTVTALIHNTDYADIKRFNMKIILAAQTGRIKVIRTAVNFIEIECTQAIYNFLYNNF